MEDIVKTQDIKFKLLTIIEIIKQCQSVLKKENTLKD